MIAFGQPSRFRRFDNVSCTVPLVGMPYALFHPKWVQYTWLYWLPQFDRTEDSRVSVDTLNPNSLYLSCWSFVRNRRDRLGFATVQKPRCIVMSNVRCEVLRVHTQFLASFYGLSLDLRWPMTVYSIWIHNSLSLVIAGVVALYAIRTLDCCALVKFLSHISTRSENMLASCNGCWYIRVFKPNLTVARKRLSDASRGSCNNPAPSLMASSWDLNTVSCESQKGAFEVAMHGSEFLYFSFVVLRLGNIEETPLIDKGIRRDSSNVSFFSITQWSSSVGSRGKNLGVSFTTARCIRICIGHSRLCSIMGTWTAWLIIKTYDLRVLTLSMVISAFTTSRSFAVPLVGSYPETLSIRSWRSTMNAWRPRTHVLAWVSSSEMCSHSDPTLENMICISPRCTVRAEKLLSETRTVRTLADVCH